MNPPCIAEFSAQLGEGASALARAPSQTAYRSVGVRAPPKHERAAQLAGEGGEGTDQHGNNTTQVSHRASSRSQLAADSRGRFLQSIGELIEAAQAASSGGMVTRD